MSSTPDWEFEEWFQATRGTKAPPVTSDDCDSCVEDCYDEDSFGDTEKDPPEFDGSFC